MKKHSFRTRLLVSLCLSVLSVGLLMVPTIYTIYENYKEDNIDEGISARHSTLDDSLSSLIEDSNYVTINIFTEENIRMLNSESVTDVDFQNLYQQQPIPSSLVQGISYYREDSDFLSATSETSTVLPEISRTVLNRVLSNEDTAYPISYCGSTYNETGSFLILGKKIHGTKSACFLYLNGKRLMNIVDSIVCLEKNFIIDSNRNIVLSKNENELGGIVINGFPLIDNNSARIDFENEESYITVHSLVELKNCFGLSWQIVSIQNYDDLFGTLKVLLIILISLTVTAFIVAVVLSFLLSKKISKPFVALSAELENTDINNPASLMIKEKKSHDEIDQLEQSYQDMVSRIHELMEENLEKMNQQRILELESLQMQINPHFLYNTLDTISWMAKINKQKEIDSLVMSLAKFFRLTLHSGDKIITVKEELEITRHYLEIQKARFPERFDYEFDIDESLKDEPTLKLILQPVVENSVKYGFDSEKGKMLLKIQTRKTDGKFEYIIQDDGVGFDVPSNLFEKKKMDEDSKSTGFGLYNVQERIHLEYGKEYGLKVESKVGVGTKTIITLPLSSHSSSRHK